LRLFDPFFQVGTGVQRNFQGTGLGLAICEKLISMMDGDIPSIPSRAWAASLPSVFRCIGAVSGAVDGRQTLLAGGA
jgi:light-regulated signal transduction histidine kinase (bacteriophytochrome)